MSLKGCVCRYLTWPRECHCNAMASNLVARVPLQFCCALAGSSFRLFSVCVSATSPSYFNGRGMRHLIREIVIGVCFCDMSVVKSSDQGGGRIQTKLS